MLPTRALERESNKYAMNATAVLQTEAELYRSARRYFGSWSAALRAGGIRPESARLKRESGEGSFHQIPSGAWYYLATIDRKHTKTGPCATKEDAQKVRDVLLQNGFDVSDPRVQALISRKRAVMGKGSVHQVRSGKWVWTYGRAERTHAGPFRSRADAEKARDILLKNGLQVGVPEVQALISLSKERSGLGHVAKSEAGLWTVTFRLGGKSIRLQSFATRKAAERARDIAKANGGDVHDPAIEAMRVRREARGSIQRDPRDKNAPYYFRFGQGRDGTLVIIGPIQKMSHAKRVQALFLENGHNPKDPSILALVERLNDGRGSTYFSKATGDWHFSYRVNKKQKAITRFPSRAAAEKARDLFWGRAGRNPKHPALLALKRPLR